MIKKILSIIFLVLVISSCDLFMSFLVSPVYNIPASRVGWTVDMVNYRIIGDSEYFRDNEWNLHWNSVDNTLRFNDYHGDTIIQTTGFPPELSDYDRVDGPLFYLELLFRHDFGSDVGVDIDLNQSVPLENIYLSENDNEEIRPEYTMAVTSASSSSYSLPEPAYLGIDGDDTTTELTGSLRIVDFDISSDHNFVNGHATCVFSNSNPAGLLYLVYYHSSGLVSLIYAHDVETTETGNFFPDGHYEYVWSVFRND